MKNNTTDRTIQHAQWLIPLVAMLLMSVTTFGQHMVGRAPSQVAVGEQFRLTYTVNTDDVNDFRAGNIPEALEVLMGPRTSTQSSFQMINGKTSSSSSVTFTLSLIHI